MTSLENVNSSQHSFKTLKEIQKFTIQISYLPSGQRGCFPLFWSLFQVKKAAQMKAQYQSSCLTLCKKSNKSISLKSQ